VTATPPPRWETGPRSHSFARLLHAEWTKLRTVRGWVLGLAAAALVTVLVGLLTTGSNGRACSEGPHEGAPNGGEGACSAPRGPGGQPVSDSFYFVRQPLDGDGSITVRITSLTGRLPSDGAPEHGQGPADLRSGLVPWAKAGVLIKESAEQGTSYAALMVTGDHGVRLQHDFTHDAAGAPARVSADSPRWLRLTRAGDTVTGEDSIDGTSWSRVGVVRLADLPSTAQIGLFATSPPANDVDQQLFGLDATGEPSQATAVFDRLDLEGTRPEGTWHGEQVGGDPVLASLGGFDELDGIVTVSGSGDIAPAVGGQALGASRAIEQSLVGTFAGLIAVIVVGTMFVTDEYRRSLIRTTMVANPRRGQALAAKAVVLGTITFVVGLAAASAAVTLGQRIARANGQELIPVDAVTELRVVVGTAALLAVVAVLALAVGSVLRRSAGAVSALLAATVLPYILATASVLPEGPSEWLLRLTPAAAFSIQQTLVRYPQVDNLYAPVNGYFPLGPWAGLAVLCAYTAIALVVATTLLHRRDA
jgi:ABC-type transport system involved in multi-copper enzyme maturation permease subunit